MSLLPISAIIPTIGRRERMVKTLRSIMAQDQVPQEIIVIDGSTEPWKRQELHRQLEDVLVKGVAVEVQPASRRGAGDQRNQGVQLSSQSFVWFLDDDVDLEPGCLSALWRAMADDAKLGGCNALTTNQQYSPPGRVMRRLLAWAGCPENGSLAGRCCGPAMNFLATVAFLDMDGTVEWLNTTCTLYRRSALPDPPFLAFFHGYSLMEDLALSLEVGKNWILRTVSDARMYHDSMPADYKSKIISRQAMELANRWFVARRIMGMKPILLLRQVLIIQGIGLLAMLHVPARWASIPGWFIGSIIGLWRIMWDSTNWRGYPSPTPSTRVAITALN